MGTLEPTLSTVGVRAVATMVTGIETNFQPSSPHLFAASSVKLSTRKFSHFVIIQIQCIRFKLILILRRYTPFTMQQMEKEMQGVGYEPTNPYGTGS